MATSIETQVPLAVDTVDWVLDGSHMTTVIVKATYALDQGPLAKLAAPLPLRVEHGDRLPLKPCAELLVLTEPEADASQQRTGSERRLLAIAVARGADVLLSKQLARGSDGRRVSLDGALPELGPVRALDRSDEPLSLSSQDDLSQLLVAPLDQRLPLLRGGERVLQTGLLAAELAEHIRLPALRPHVVATHGGTQQQIPLLGDTLTLDVAGARLSITWRGAITTRRSSSLPSLRVTMAPIAEVEEIAAAPPAWQQPRARRRRRPHERLTVVSSSNKLHTHAFAWQRGPGDACCTLVAKGTFVLQGGEPASLADEQPALSGGPDTTDLAPFKPRTDVLLTGTAYPAEDERLATVTLTLGNIRKQVVALGPRRWLNEHELSEPEPFESLELAYRHAFGGPDDEHNPLGTGLNGTAPPRLERPGALITSRSDRPAPACFAAISAQWPVRLALLGTFDDDWSEQRWPALPSDADPSLYQEAPADQRCAYLRGDERFEVTAVRPGGETLSGRLPGLSLRAYVQHIDGGIEPLSMPLDTVSIDADGERITLLWRGVAATADGDASDIDRLLLAVRANERDANERDANERDANERDANEQDSDEREGLTHAWGKLASEDDGRFGGPAPPARPLGSADQWLQMMRDLPAPIAALRHARMQSSQPQPPPPLSRAQIEQLRDDDALAGRDLTGADLRDLDLRQRDLGGAILQHALLQGCCLDGARLQGADLSWAVAHGCSFRGADLQDANLRGAALEGADLSETQLARACLSGAALSQARLLGARGDHVDLSGSTLKQAQLQGAQLPAVDLTEATLDEASFRDASLDDARLYEARGENVVLDGASLANARLENSRWTSLSAREVQARGSNWEGAELPEADLMRAQLTESSWVAAKLDGCIFSEADARDGRFRNASLRGASLLRTNLMRAGFEGADLTGADMRGANLYQVETHRATTAGLRLELAHVAGSRLAALQEQA